MIETRNYQRTKKENFSNAKLEINQYHRAKEVNMKKTTIRTDNYTILAYQNATTFKFKQKISITDR